MQSHIFSILKACSYRVIGSTLTFIISYILTGDAHVSIGITILEFFTKLAFFYIHDRVWIIIEKKYTNSN